MDNNTSNDGNNSQSSQDYSQNVMSNDSEQDGRSLSKKNIPVIVISIVLFTFAVYMVYAIFSEPVKQTGPNPIGIKGPVKKVGLKDEKKEVGDTSPVNVELPQPPVAMLQPPPPPTDQLSYAPPPPVPPSQLVSDNTNKGNTLTNLSKGSFTDEPPPPPPLPAIIPPAPEISGIGKSKAINLKDKETKQRIRSNILVMDGGVAGRGAAAGRPSSTAGNDPNGAFSDSVLRATTAEKAIATGLNNLNMTIAQGKIINAVLETAVNTDLPGVLRAIVSRDTYAETGRDVLIPKGSRLIGTYNTGVVRGQNRVMIVWTRLIRPDGVDIMIGSPGIDELGRAGITGIVDNKLYDIFSAAILTTMISIGAAVASDAVLPVDSGTSSSTTTNPNGNTTTTSTPAQQAAASAVSDFGSTAKEVVQRIVDIRPTITIDQGTLVNVFVNRDLTFPSNMGGGVFIQ